MNQRHIEARNGHGVRVLVRNENGEVIGSHYMTLAEFNEELRVARAEEDQKISILLNRFRWSSKQIALLTPEQRLLAERNNYELDEIIKDLLNENKCENCSRSLPGGYIEVDDVKDPHCKYCGRKIERQSKYD